MKIFILMLIIINFLIAGEIENSIEELVSSNIINIILTLFLLVGSIIALMTTTIVPLVISLFISVMFISLVEVIKENNNFEKSLENRRNNEKSNISLKENNKKETQDIEIKETPNINIVNNGTAEINFNTYNGPVTIIYDKK